MFLKHVRVTHADTDHFQIQCGLQGCKRTFRKFHTYRNHVYTWHDMSEFESEQSTIVNPSENLDLLAEDNTLGEEFDDQFSITPSHVSVEDTLKKAAAQWILKTREIHRIPVSTMNDIIVEVQYLFEVAVSEIRDRVQRKIQDTSASSDVSELILEELGDSNPMLDLFHGLKTHHQQMRYFQAHFRLVVSKHAYLQSNKTYTSFVFVKEPVKITLGVVRKPHGRGSKRRLVEKDEGFVYVPLLKTLETLLMDDGVMAEVCALL